MSKEQEFINAIHTNNLEEMKRLISEGVSVDAREDINSNKTALMCAAIASKEATKLLIEKGANIHAKDVYGSTALSWAASTMRADAAQILIENGAEFKNIIMHGSPIIVWAARCGHTELVKAMIKAGADLNVAGVDFNDSYSDKQTALSWAEQRGHTEIVRILKENGAKTEEDIVIDGEPMLVWAAIYGRTEKVKEMIKSGANPNVSGVNASSYSNDKKTALRWAAERGHTEIVKILMDNGVRAEDVPVKGEPMLVWAAQNGYTRAVQELLTQKVDPNTQNNKKETALIWASLRGYIKMAQILVQYGANVELASKNGHTPLICAAIENHPNIIEFLITQCNTKLNAQTSRGETALTIALATNKANAAAAAILLKHSEEDIRENFKQTCLANPKNNIVQGYIEGEYYVGAYNLLNALFSTFQGKFDFLEQMGITAPNFISLLQMNDNHKVSFSTIDNIYHKLGIENTEKIISKHKSNIRLLDESASFEEVASLGKMLLVDKSLPTDIRVAIASYDITDRTFAESLKKSGEAQGIGQ